MFTSTPLASSFLRLKVAKSFNSSFNLSPKSRSFANFDSHVARFDKFGSPPRVLNLEKETISSDKLLGSQVLLKVLAAPIHPGDISHIEGAIGHNTPLPGVPGLEGVAQVIEVGPNSKLQRNDRVLVTNPRVGTWRTHIVTEEENLKRLPKNLENSTASVFSVVPMTALALLEEIVKLNPGDVIIQGCGESTLGRVVAQIAFARQIKVISVSTHSDQKKVDQLKSTGATVVISAEQLHSTNTLSQLTKGLPKPKLALNPVGGLVAIDLARSLGSGGTFVTFGNLSKHPLQVPASALIFNNISLRGFSLLNWLETHSEKERNTLFDKVSKLWSDGTIQLATEVIRFPNTTSELLSVLEKQNDPHREKKLVFSLEK